MAMDLTKILTAPPAPTPEQLAEAARLRGKKRAAEQSAADSWERSDTDGFLSQWASGLTAQEHEAQARVLESGGYAEHVGLYHLDGRRARAKLMPTKYGTRWMVLDENDKAILWLTAFPKRKTTLAKHGFEERTEWAPSQARLVGEGHGLSGRAWVAVVRTDGL